MFKLAPNKLFYLTLLLLPLSSTAWAGQTERVSVSTSGEQANDYSTYPSLSADGRYVAFRSKASNLVEGDTNDAYEIFVRDRQTGITERVSVSSSGEQANSYSDTPSLSADGRYVAFTSEASNLVEGDTNGYGDVFIRDRQTGITERVNVSYKGEQANNVSGYPSLSADGRYVAFVSNASNLVEGDTNNYPDIFVRDRQTGKNERVSVSSSGKQGDGYFSGSPSVSADGRYVAFASAASNLVEGDTNGYEDVFVRDRQTGKTERVSVSSYGEQTYIGESYSPSLSANGRYVAFQSWASNLIEGDTNKTWDIFVHDRQTGKTERVSVSSSGEQADSGSNPPSLSADGRYVAFQSDASNLVEGDTNGISDIFIHDRQTGITTRSSLFSSRKQANDHSTSPSLSADGRYVAFGSWASNLVEGDTNGFLDIFVRDRLINIKVSSDLEIAVASKPSSLPPNGQGAFQYTITNNGPSEVPLARLLHSVSNGKIVNFTASQGKCRRYATISLCNLGKLAPKASVTLDVTVKVANAELRQYVSVSPLRLLDPVSMNDSVAVNTEVTKAQ